MFSSLCKEQALDKKSDFQNIAQAAIRTYYIPPYPGAKDKNPGEVNRKHHGGVHVSNTAYNVEMLIELYRKYNPELLKHPNGDPLSDSDIKLLKLAAIWHDSANTSEVKGDDKEHANNFRKDMLSLGYSEKDIEPFAFAIFKKDGEKGKAAPPSERNEPKTIFQKILQSADCLDIIRVARESFDKNYLDILRDLKEVPGFEKELDEIIYNHKATLDTFEGTEEISSALHRSCEFSQNCYNSVETAHYQMFLLHIITELLKVNVDISLEELDQLCKQKEIDILDIYNREKSKKVSEIISLTISKENKNNENKYHETEDPVVKRANEQGVFYRAISYDKVEDEFKTIAKNEEVLRRESLNAESLRDYLHKQKGKDKVFTPDGFKWRPCSFMKSGIPVDFFSGGIAIIINPENKGTIATHFYKKNVISAMAAHGAFQYRPERGGKKDKSSFQGIRSKVEEQDRRRRGLERDPGMHYFGKNKLSWSEILITYQKQGIEGIVIGGNDKKSAEEAILLRAKLGHPFRKIYHIDSNHNLVPVSNNDLIKQCKSPTDSAEVALNLKVQNINTKIDIPGAIKVSEFKLEYVHYPQYNSTWDTNTRSLTFNLTGADKNIIEKIRYVLYTIKNLGEEYIERNFIDIRIIETPTQFSVIFLNEFDKKSKMETIKQIDMLLNKIEYAASPALSLNDIKFGETTIDNDKIQSLKKINKKENPLQFEFAHPNKEKVKCIASVNEKGLPTLKCLYPDGKEYETESQLLPAIAKQYYALKVAELNTHLKTDPVINYLNDCNIKNLTINLVSTSEKLLLEITIDHEEKTTDEKTKNILSSLFPFSKSRESIQKGKYVISTTDIDTVDILGEHISAMALKNNNELKKTKPNL